MLSFKDALGTHVELFFGPNPYQMEAEHVLCLLKTDGKWLLTKHANRGIEFPGGKVEEGETLEEAVRREVYEETGAIINSLHQFAQYIVYANPPFCKAVFTGALFTIDDSAPKHETDGICWMSTESFEKSDKLSFHMQDEGMNALRKWVETNVQQWNN